MYSNPISTSIKLNKTLKKQRKDGTVLKYNCPYCIYQSFHKKRMVAHIERCTQHNEPKPIIQQMEVHQEHQVMINQNADQSEVHLQLSLMNARVVELEKIIKSGKTSGLYINQHQQSIFDRIKMLVEIVMKESNAILSIIKYSLTKQLNYLFELGFSSNQLKSEITHAVFKTLNGVNFIDGFSLFKKHMKDFQKYLFDQFKGQVLSQWRNKMIRAWNFLKRYQQEDFVHQHRIVEDLMKEKSYKRIHIVTLYNKMINQFSEKFRFSPLPKRLTAKSAVIFKHEKLSMDKVKQEVKSLLAAENYQLATDIWMVTSVGLRLKQLRKVRFKTVEQNKFADFIRIFEYKNKHQTSRVIPNSLKNMIESYHITYPLSDERLRRLKRYCFEKFEAFYGLRSLCITNIIQCLVKGDSLARFHKSSSTTIKYYLNQNSSQLINNLFSLEGFNEVFQKTGITLLIKQDGLVEEIIDNNGEIKINQSDAIQIVEDNERDHLSMIQSSQIQEIVEDGNEETIRQLIFQKFKLDSEIELEKQEYSSISEAIIGYDNNEEDFHFASNVAEKCETTVKLITFNDISTQSSQFKTPAQSEDQIVVVKRVKPDRVVYCVEDKQINREELRRKFERKCKRKPIKEIQNLPVLTRPKGVCSYCKIGQIYINRCEGNQHFKVLCNNCSIQAHKCPQFIQGFLTLTIQNISFIESQLSVKSMKAISRSNNVEEIIQSQRRTLIRRNLMKSGTPRMKCAFPVFSSQVTKEIQYNRNSQVYLPIQIKTTDHGYGVFTRTKIEKEVLICTYNGVVGTNYNIDFESDSVVDLGEITDEGDLLIVALEAKDYCNVGRYLNSSSSKTGSEKNCVMTIGLIETNLMFELVLLICSCRQIQKGEQLLWYYGKGYWDEKKSELKRSSQREMSQQEMDLEQHAQEKQFVDKRVEEMYKDTLRLELQEKIGDKITMMQNKKRVIEKDDRFNAYGIYQDNKSIVFNQKLQVQIASIIKLFVFLFCQQLIDQGDLTISQQFQMPQFRVRNSTMCHLVENVSYSVQDLLHGMLLASGCDAAHCLCYGIGQKFKAQGEGQIDWFIKQLNRLALNKQFLDTSIRDVTGLGNSTSTVLDLVKLLKMLRDSRLFNSIVRKSSYYIISGDEKILVSNTNTLLHAHIFGKTGNGRNSGFCFAGYQNQKGKEAYMIVLGGRTCNSRFDQCMVLMNDIRRIK